MLPIAAARADAFVYWTVFGSAGNGLVSRANTDGTSPNYTFLRGLFGAQAIAVDSTYLYWANGPQGIGRATLDGKTVESNFIVAAFTATALAVDSTHGFIYWTNARTGTIGRAPLSGGTSGLNNSLVDTLGPPTGVAVDSVNGSLYWTLNPGAGQGVIGRANLDGTSPNRTFLHGLFGAQGLTLDSTVHLLGQRPQPDRARQPRRHRTSSRGSSSAPASAPPAARPPARRSAWRWTPRTSTGWTTTTRPSGGRRSGAAARG